MQVRVRTKCTTSGDEKSHLADIDIESNILELKKRVERQVSVGACDQIIKYRGRVLEDKRPLASLYVQENDEFTLEYASSCDIASLDTVIDAFKRFVSTVYEVYNGNMMCHVEHLDEILEVYSSVDDALGSCSNSLFMPWNDVSSVANRHFFRQEGGLEMLSNIYKFSAKEFQVYGLDDVDEWRLDLDRKQLILHYMCLVALWNYSELKADRHMVLEKIGLDMFVHSLVTGKNHDIIIGNNNIDVYPHINEAAIGCLAQYIEIPEIQISFAANLEAVTKLVSITSDGTTLYHQEIAANTLFCCSNHPTAATNLVKNKVHVLVVKKMQPILEECDQNDLDGGLSVPLKYFLCLFLANIQTLPTENMLSDGERNDIDVILEKFLALHSPSEIGDYEREHSYVWITLAPFIQLALSSSRRPAQPSSTEQCSSLPNKAPEQYQYSFSPAAKLGVFSLCHLAGKNPNQSLFKKEKLLDYLVCISWFVKNCKEKTFVPDLAEIPNIDPPQLQSVSKAYLAKCYGHGIS